MGRAIHFLPHGFIHLFLGGLFTTRVYLRAINEVIMSDELQVTGISKRERYESLYPQLQALLLDEDDLIANMANVAAALKEGFGFSGSVSTVLWATNWF